MSITDLFHEQRIRGRVLDRYRLENGNLAMIIEEDTTSQRYSVEFKTNKAKPCLDNLYGLLSEPYLGKGEYLENMLNEGQYVDMTVNPARGPLRHAYALHSVSSRRSYGPQPHTPRITYAQGQNY